MQLLHNVLPFFVKHTHRIAFSLTVLVFIFSCSDDDTVRPDVPPPGRDGYFIVNEGAFQGGNTSLSYYDRSRDTVLNNVFATANGSPLGDQTQSMTVIGDRGFIVVQNSGKIEVINRDDFTSIATITDDIVSPRYLIGVDDTKAYVTDWGADGVSGTVKVIDLMTYEVTKTIPVGQGANELLLLQDNRVYVANNGSIGYDTTVMVLDSQVDTVVDTIVVGDNPQSLSVDSEGHLWVTGSGRWVFTDTGELDETQSTPGFIARLEEDQVAFNESFDQISFSGPELAIAEDQVYFRYEGGIYRLEVDDTDLPESPFIEGRFLGLAVDATSNEVLVGDEVYTSEGNFYRYSPQGQLIKTYLVGIAPNGFAF